MSEPSFFGSGLALILVLAAFVGAAWLAKRQRPAGMRSTRLSAVAQVSLGGRERVVVVEIANQWHVLGVAPGSVRPIATMPRPDDAAAAPIAGDSAFAQVLARLGGSGAR